MMPTKTTLALLCLAESAIAFNCSIPPIYVDIHFREVGATGILEYGTFIGLGSPSQNQSLWPDISQNETTFASALFCAEGSSSTCRNDSHSVFAPGLSTSWIDTPNYHSLDNATGSTSITAQFGTDNLNLYSHYFDPSPPTVTTIPSFPATLLSDYTSPTSPFFGPAGLLGLGPSSTLLTHLRDLGLIASRSFSLYLGTGYPRAGGSINGSLVLGGYDAARFSSPVHGYAIDSANQRLNVEVAQIQLTHSNDNSTIDILSRSSKGFTAELTTSQYALTLPRSITNALAAALASTSTTTDPEGETVLVASPTFTGSLTITLADGFSLTFPPEWVSNTSHSTPFSSASNATTDDNDDEIFRLGAAFLSFAYLTASYDSTPPTFFLAPAVPSAAFVSTNTLCPSINAGTPTPYTAPPISGFARTGAAGAIVGGVIGGIAVGILLWVCMRGALRRREMRRRAREGMGRSKGIGGDEWWEMETGAGAGAGRAVGVGGGQWPPRDDRIGG